MKHKHQILWAFAGLLGSGVWFACGSNESSHKVVVAETDSIQLQAQRFFQALPAQAENPENPITAEKVALGKMLYYDTKLSMKGNNSCNSCHDLSKFGVDNEVTSTGDDGKKGDRNSPTVFNAALHSTQFWDGRAKDVEDQAGMPILNPVEMHIPNKKFLEDKLGKDENYKKMFAAAFPDDKSPVNYSNIQKAIGAFERTLLTPSKFDEYITGNSNALNAEEKKGLELFVKVGCTTCHSGVVLGGQMFQKFGLYTPYWNETHSKKIDYGRVTVTKQPGDSFMFKVPSLRNIIETAPYFHDGSVMTIEEAIKVMAITEVNKTLTDEEVKSIALFLKTLTGKVADDVKVNPIVAKK